MSTLSDATEEMRAAIAAGNALWVEEEQCRAALVDAERASAEANNRNRAARAALVAAALLDGAS